MAVWVPAQLSSAWTSFTEWLAGRKYFCFCLPWGCSYQEQPQGSDNVQLLPDGAWRVEDIDGRGFIDYSMVTISFADQTRVNGNGGCNPYFGSVALEERDISFSLLGSGRRACAPSLMQQEQRFFDSLSAVTTFELVDNTVLHLLDAEGSRIIRAVRLNQETPQPLDRALEYSTTYLCEDEIVEIRFLGPDTIELSFSGERFVLVAERAASGAKYVGDDILFWSKGAEALLEQSGQRLRCERFTEGS